MSVLRFETPPVAKGRPRVRLIRGRPAIYTPAKTRDFEALVREWALSHFKEPLEGPASLSLVFELVPPASWSKKKRALAIAGEVLPSVRPDIDNYAKAFIDGLNGVAFKDDGQLVELYLAKRYADKAGVLMSLERATLAARTCELKERPACLAGRAAGL